METKRAKNYKELEALSDSCEKAGDTLFAIYSNKEKTKDSLLAFCGDAKVIAYALEFVINKSMDDECEDENADEITNALLNAIKTVIGGDIEKSARFCKMINLAIGDGVKMQLERFEEICEKEHVKPKRKFRRHNN